MKAQKLLNSLNFADIVLISKTARPDDSTFPYVPQVCRCTNCIYGTSHADIEDICNDEIVDFDTFCIICYSVRNGWIQLRMLKISQA